MRITDIRCAIIGDNPIVRVVTDEGVDGFGPVETYKPYITPMVPYFRGPLLGQDPTNVEDCVRRIRRLGGTKPWGALVSAIEIALWDIAGKASGLPVHKLLGGAVRDAVRVYNGGVRTDPATLTPTGYAEAMSVMKEAREGFTIIKDGVGFHGFMAQEVDGFYYGVPRRGEGHPNRGFVTNAGLDHLVACVGAMKDVLGNDVALALDMGPGWMPSDAIRVARAMEEFDLLWAEDLITGDYVPWVHAEQYREVTRSTSTPTHTGEQLYTRHQFVELITTQAVRVVGPDPCDVGGLAELKWVAEFADLYGIGIAPHGVHGGLFGLAALVQVCATLPDNFLAFEYSVASRPWWYDIVDGLPDPIVVGGHVPVSTRPGLGLEFRRDAARAYLRPEDAGFFDWS